jgi:hypothetical protein
LIICVPLSIVIAISIPQGIKVANRTDDGDLGLRIVEGNGVTLAWAPRGPAGRRRRRMGRGAGQMQVFIRRRPDGHGYRAEYLEAATVDEAVRSMMLHGENAGGAWDAQEEEASYEKTPDKESPLWDVHSKVIYYWTADTSAQDADQAYIIVYDGGVYDKRKIDSFGYLSFRAVKDA